MVKRIVLSLFCAVALVAATAQAQEHATLTLTSGEQVSGQLVDLNASGYTVRVNGQDRQIQAGQVAAIDFGGGIDWSKYNGSPVVVLRNGQVINGQLDDIGGTAPLRLTVKTASGSQDYSSNDVAEIIMSRPANANTVATTGQTAASGNTFTVNGNQDWTPTGITVRKGQLLSVSASGEIQLSPDSNDTATVDGAKSSRFAPRAPLPRTPAGALIGRIGNGAPFAIGSRSTITAPASGQLFLGINDDGFTDNQGSFQVTVNVGRR
ncbi:MAG TPA: hypothetical protein VNR64_21415 [Vicinamibacterales bacterium]|nr:hypothetical protein [Vicinamibacterales bacterium]